MTTDAAASTTPREPILSVRDLRVTYRTERKGKESVPAVRGVSLDLYPGEVLALVGESACGKSTVGYALLDLLPDSAERTGDVFYGGRRLFDMTEEELRAIRGREIAVSFQDALSALTPTMTVGEQMAEAFIVHLGLNEHDAADAVRDALSGLLPDARRVMASYPHQLSGGMAQRVMIAMSTVLKPRVIIADEPTSSLDVSVRQIALERLEILRDGGTSLLLITHDFGVVARLADRVCVMYAGKIVEEADVRTTFRWPKHPYTFGLLNSLPSIAGRDRLQPMQGQPPDPTTLGPECPFLPRCNKAIAHCRTAQAPELVEVEESSGQHVACYNPIAVAIRD